MEPSIIEGKRNTNKTLRLAYNWSCLSTDYTVTRSCVYPPDTEKNVDHHLIPISAVDSLLTLREIIGLAGLYNYHYQQTNEFSLSHHNLFNEFIEELEKHAAKKTVGKVDIITGLDCITYELPLIDILNTDKFPQRDDDLYNSIPCAKKYTRLKTQVQPRKRVRGWKYYESKRNLKQSNIITIEGNQYDSTLIYQRTGTGGFSPIVIHPTPDIPFDYNEDQYVRFTKKFNKDSITISFPNEQSISDIVLRPETMKFEYISPDRKTRISKRSPSLRVLENKPGYIEKFDLYFRSSDTYGQWVKCGTYDGNKSMFDATRIKLDDTIHAKEIRIVPNSFVNSFDKIQLSMIGRCTVKSKVNMDDATIVYKVYVPHDGQYRKIRSYEMDSVSRGRIGCRCANCTGRKGMFKNKSRAFKEACDDI